MLPRFIAFYHAQTPLIKRITLGILVLLFVSFIYFIVSFIRAEQESRTLTLYGNVDIRYVNLGFRVSGKVTKMNYEEGDYIKANTLLATLDNQPYIADVENAQAKMVEAQENFAKLQHGNRPEEIEQARALVQQQQAAFINADVNLTRQVKLLPSGATTKQNYDAAVAVRDEALATLNSAQEGLHLALAGFRQEDIAAGQAAFEATQASLLSAQISLSDTNLLAPADGQLLTRVQEPGAVVAQGAPVYVLSLLTPVWVRAFVEEPFLTRVKPGMSALVYADGHDKPFKAQIGYISSTAEFTPKNIETQDLRTSLVYRMRLIVQDPKGILRQGMPVTVKIKT
jgi:HlyD family secretion protein